MKIIYKKLDELIPYQFNNKTHSERQIDMLANMIREYDFNQPLIIDQKNVIIAGHGRREASKKLELKEIPCIMKEKLTDTQIKKYRIMDNKIAELADRSLDNLKIEIEELDDPDLKALFADLDIKRADDVNNTDDDIQDHVPGIDREDVQIQSGDFFLLGNHYLLCGDSGSQKDVDILMQKEKGQMIFTDPPYNVNYKGSGKKTSKGIKNDNLSDENFYNLLLKRFKTYITTIDDKAGVYVFHSHTTQLQFEQAMAHTGFSIKKQLIRNKPGVNHVGGDYKQKHEPFFYACKKGHLPKFYGDVYDTTVIDLFENMTDKEILEIVKKDRKAEEQGKTTVRSMQRHNTNDYVHPTQKPVGLVYYCIQNSSKIGDIVVDLFGGSGTTLIACEKANRSCRMIELDPFYIQTIIQRYHDYTKGNQTIKCLNRDFDVISTLQPSEEDK